VRIDYDSAGVKAVHYANGDTDYRDANAFVEGLEAQIGLDEIDRWLPCPPLETRTVKMRFHFRGALQAQFDDWTENYSPAWAEMDGW